MDAPRPDAHDAARIDHEVVELLRRTHLSAPSGLAGVVAEQARSIGAEELVLYLMYYELHELVPLPSETTTGSGRCWSPAQSAAGPAARR